MHRLNCTDWRYAPDSMVRSLYEAETRRWRSTLDWDTASNWTVVEQGRRLGVVSGLIVTDQDHQVVGWSYYLLEDRTLQIGGFVASSDACTAVLLDGILSDHTLAAVDSVTLFAPADAVGLVPALKRREMSVCRYWYLSRDLRLGPDSLHEDARRWRPEDLGPTADLLGSAYAREDVSRPFAPRGTAAEWRHYVEQLVTADGCGTLLPQLSLCISAGLGRLAAVALVTRIGANTSHLAQLAVAPGFRKRGLGAGLLAAVCRAASRQGFGRMTLLVAGQNQAARKLYEGAGFVERSTFVSAGLRHQPRRSTSVAAGANAMTLR
jgi:ribosomal protein S18 acetylase RimI-like enzyme